MNFAIDIPRFNINHLLLLEKRQNIVMNGYFTKLNLSTEIFTMNGLFMTFPIDINECITTKTRQTISFNPYSPNNIQIIQCLSKIEVHILDFYNINNLQHCKKKQVLVKHLQGGSMRFYIDREDNSDKVFKKTTNSDNYILKISGIWETNNEIGITYKLLQTNDVVSPGRLLKS
jgi:hypothetical protein